MHSAIAAEEATRRARDAGHRRPADHPQLPAGARVRRDTRRRARLERY